jgi:hypothetical protein
MLKNFFRAFGQGPRHHVTASWRRKCMILISVRKVVLQAKASGESKSRDYEFLKRAASSITDRQKEIQRYSTAPALKRQQAAQDKYALKND